MNRILDAIPPSLSLKIGALAKTLAAEGRSICAFAAGEPDFDTPEHVKDAAIEALHQGQTKYAPAVGLLELREAIAEKLEKENGLAYAPDQIVVSNGAKHSIFNIVMALCNPGDEVIIPAPYWLSYPEMVRIAGAVPVFVPCREEDDFRMTAAQLEAAITERTRAIIINTPSNPIGVVHSREELQELAEVALRHDVFILSDEIYEKLVYDEAEHVSIGNFSEEVFARTITINGFSKAYAMTGWRLGYCAAPRGVVKAMSALQSHSTSGPNTFAMYGGIAALKGPADCVERMLRAFDERRTYMYERLHSINGITCVKPTGAFYMLPNIAACGMGSVQFAEQLLEHEGVAVVPGLAFGADTHIRLSYACSMDNIREGLDRLEKFFDGCGQSGK